MSNLILFTNRSGSTLLSDIIAYNDKSINLGEGLHSLARHYNYNLAENRQTDLYREFAQTSISSLYHNMKTRGSDHIGFFQAKQSRIDLLKKSNLQWTVKENLEKLTLDSSFIDYCISNKINVYLTHRRDIESQFISKINARYRLEIAKLGTNNESQFIYTNQDHYHKYSEMRVPFSWLHLYVNIFIEQLMMWRIVYEKYKDVVKVVSYEDVIKPMKFESIDINESIVNQYKNETKHLVPTPHNSYKIVVTDEHPATMKGAWEQSLHYIKRFKYLVEI